MNITKAVKWILIINTVIFVLTMFSKSLLVFLSIAPYGGGFMPWQPITYQFAHSGFMHFFGNMLFLLMIGPRIEEEYFRSEMKFTLYYLACGIGAGILGNLFNRSGIIMGASGSLFALLVPLWIVFREVTVSYWGLFQMKMKTLIYIIIGIQVLFFLAQGDFSAFGHLLGLVMGIIICYFYGKGTFIKKQEQIDQSDFL